MRRAAVTVLDTLAEWLLLLAGWLDRPDEEEGPRLRLVKRGD